MIQIALPRIVRNPGPCRPGHRLSLVMSVFLLAALLLHTPQTHAQSFFKQFKDVDDGWLDLSDWVLNNSVGFMPVPIIITEPAVGEGIGLAAVFFHPPKDYDPTGQADADAQTDTASAVGAVPDTDDFVLPDITVAAAAITNNNSWLVGGGHIAHWKDDHIRYEGVIGYASLNLQFYGLAGSSDFDEGLAFTGEGFFLDQPIAFRLKESNFFLGVGYNFLKIDIEFDLGLPTLLPPLNAETTLSGLEAFLSYDSRDTIFTPSTGMDAEVSVDVKSDVIGSDFDFTGISAEVHKYWKLNPKFVLGLRGEVENVSGDVPFYSVPFISLRGIPAMRYQGESVVVAETELRWAFHRRVSLIGFIGVGRAADSFSDLDSATSEVGKGIGIRYFAARKLGMHVGIDVAQGPEDTYWYIQFGSAW